MMNVYTFAALPVSCMVIVNVVCVPDAPSASEPEATVDVVTTVAVPLVIEHVPAANVGVNVKPVPVDVPTYEYVPCAKVGYNVAVVTVNAVTLFDAVIASAGTPVTLSVAENGIIPLIALSPILIDERYAVAVHVAIVSGKVITTVREVRPVQSVTIATCPLVSAGSKYPSIGISDTDNIPGNFSVKADVDWWVLVSTISAVTSTPPMLCSFVTVWLFHVSVVPNACFTAMCYSFS